MPSPFAADNMSYCYHQIDRNGLDKAEKQHRKVYYCKKNLGIVVVYIPCA